MVRRSGWFAAWVVLGGMVVADAAEPLPAPLGYVCGRANVAVDVDGRLDDPAWKAAPWTTDFVDIEGAKQPLPRHRTRAKLVWDDEYLYIAAELTEPDVWGTLTDHDAVIFQDNDFEVFLDPDGDNHKYFELEINALGTEWDLFLPKPYRDNGKADNGWEIPGLKKAIHVNGTLNNPGDIDQGWTVELAIPWASLAKDAGMPTPPRNGDQWRLNFSRVEWDTAVEGGKTVKIPKTPEHNWVWSPQGVIDMHQPERWGYLQFATEAPGTATYRVDPTGPLRDRLMTVYHAERAFTKTGKRWAGSLAELGLDPADLAISGGSIPAIRFIPGGYEAFITLDPTDGHPARTWAVDQDSRVTSRP